MPGLILVDSDIRCLRLIVKRRGTALDAVATRLSSTLRLRPEGSSATSDARRYTKTRDCKCSSARQRVAFPLSARILRATLADDRENDLCLPQVFGSQLSTFNSSSNSRKRFPCRCGRRRSRWRMPDTTKQSNGRGRLPTALRFSPG